MVLEDWSFWDAPGTWRTPSVAIAMVIYSIFLTIFVKKNLSPEKPKRKYFHVATFFLLSAWVVNILAQVIENKVLNKIKGWIGLHLFWGAPLDVMITILLPLLPPAVLGLIMFIRAKSNRSN